MSRILTLLTLLALLLAPASTLWAADYQYIAPEKVKQRLEQKLPMTLLDIQVKSAFDKEHIQSAVPTYAYPVKSTQDREKLDGTVKQVKHGDDIIVVICPRGAGGAKRTIDYLAQNGIDNSRLFILEHGQSGWPYPDLLTN